MANPSNQTLQQIQVVPVSSIQNTASNGQIVLQPQPQPQQAQIIQTSDGQTFIYQPMAMENNMPAQTPQAQPTGLSKYLLDLFNMSLYYGFLLDLYISID